MSRAAACLCLLAGLAAAQAADSWKAVYNRGAEALERGEPREAAAEFEKALGLAPGNAGVLHGLMTAELAAGRIGAALEASGKLLTRLREGGGDFALSMAAAQALAAHGQLAGAAEFYKLAQQHAPAAIDGRPSAVYFDNLFAALFAQMKQGGEAVARLERLAAAEPQEPAHVYQLGLMLIQTARFGRAYDTMQRGVERFPASFEVQLAYALSCYFSGRNEQAEAAYRRLTEMRPASAQPYFALGNFYADTGRDSEAAAAFARAVKLEPGQFLNQYMYGVELYRTQKIAPAEASLRRAVELNPGHADSHYWLGKVYLAEDRAARALGEFEEAVKLEPKHIGAYYQLALLYQRRGEKEKAREALRRRGELMQQLHQGIVAERMTQ
ncbi:MAG TPA: tetratricopeptide repeat protein [Bryobacteraceae bacterium]|nr:tetratricopeptide repeat protein [Bryobacteraceae bacterium]